MQKILFFLLFLTFISLLSAQEYSATDTVYLRSGKVICGELQSGRNDDFIKMSVNGKLQLFSSTDIKRIGSSLNGEFKDFGWGLKVGAGLSGVSSSDETDSKLGIVLGVFSSYRINRFLSLQTEVLYQPKGYKYSKTLEYHNYLIPYDFECDLSSVEIPVLLKYALPEKQGVKSSIYGGPFVDFITGSEMTEILGDYDTIEETLDIGETLNKIHFGAAAGAEVLFRVNGYDLFCDVRYSYSFTPLYKDGSLQKSKLLSTYLPELIEENPEVFNTAFTLTLGFMF